MSAFKDWVFAEQEKHFYQFQDEYFEMHPNATVEEANDAYEDLKPYEPCPSDYASMLEYKAEAQS